MWKETSVAVLNLRDVDPDIIKSLKVEAALRGVTMRDVAFERLRVVRKARKRRNGEAGAAESANG